MKKALIGIIVLLVFSSSTSVFAETIVFKWGTKVQAEIIAKTNEYIKIKADGVELVYRLEDIQTIDGQAPVLVKDVSGSTPFQSKAFPVSPQDIFQRISPAVVYITTQTLTGEQYLGSGFIVDSQGVVMTNYHVIQGVQNLSVQLKDGSSYPAQDVIYYDVNQDVFIFTIPAQNLPTIPLGDSRAISIGETIFCIGNPLGLEYSFSDGLLSGVRDFQNLKWLQFTAPISPGNSGGPLINRQGEAIGMVTFLMLGGQNLNFALAINEIKPFISNSAQMSLADFTKSTLGIDNLDALKEEYLAGTTDESLNPFVGTFEISYSENPISKTSYRGEVFIAKTVDTYKLFWKFPNSIPYKGVGIAADNLLCVGWSVNEYNSIVVYKVEQGKLYGRWATTGSGVIAQEDLLGPEGLNGTYQIVNSSKPQGGSYTGSVFIKKLGKVYYLEWMLPNETYSGVGILQDNLLIVGRNCAVVYYHTKGNELVGRWAIFGADDIGRETLIKNP